MSGHSVENKRLDDFVRVTFPSATRIELIDRWNIRNRSKRVFGTNEIETYFSEISLSETKRWARSELRDMSLQNPFNIIIEKELVLSELIWSVSWLARMLMLSQGTVCDSKRAALEWLASKYEEINIIVNLLLKDYSKSDNEPISIAFEQSMFLRSFCLGLIKNCSEMTKFDSESSY